MRKRADEAHMSKKIMPVKKSNENMKMALTKRHAPAVSGKSEVKSEDGTSGIRNNV
jgi:hypothetical protein